MPTRGTALDHVPAGMLSSRIAAGIAASTRLSATPLVDAEAMAQLPDPRAAPAPGAADHRPADEGPDPVALDPWLQTELQQRMERHRRELLPEYERRLRVDGEAAADTWLRHEAVERGRGEADALRGGDDHR